MLAWIFLNWIRFVLIVQTIDGQFRLTIIREIQAQSTQDWLFVITKLLFVSANNLVEMMIRSYVYVMYFFLFVNVFVMLIHFCNVDI